MDRSMPSCRSTPGTTPTPGADEAEIEDDVKLGEAGWRERYYRFKFKVDENDAAFQRNLCEKYMEGLMWVMKYYY
jgi:5'-3' exoribonuclease 2